MTQRPRTVHKPTGPAEVRQHEVKSPETVETTVVLVVRNPGQEAPSVRAMMAEDLGIKP